MHVIDPAVHRRLFMIWFAGVDLKRAKDLLQQHHAAEPVRQRHIGNGELEVCAARDRGTEPQRAADQTEAENCHPYAAHV